MTESRTLTLTLGSWPEGNFDSKKSDQIRVYQLVCLHCTFLFWSGIYSNYLHPCKGSFRLTLNKAMFSMLSKTFLFGSQSSASTWFYTNCCICWRTVWNIAAEDRHVPSGPNKAAIHGPRPWLPFDLAAAGGPRSTGLTGLHVSHVSPSSNSSLVSGNNSQ